MNGVQRNAYRSAVSLHQEGSSEISPSLRGFLSPTMFLRIADLVGLYTLESLLFDTDPAGVRTPVKWSYFSLPAHLMPTGVFSCDHSVTQGDCHLPFFGVFSIARNKGGIIPVCIVSLAYSGS